MFILLEWQMPVETFLPLIFHQLHQIGVDRRITYNFSHLTHKIGSWPHLWLTSRLLPKRRGTHKKASLPKPPERLVLEGNFSEQTLCHSKQATCMPPKWP